MTKTAKWLRIPILMGVFMMGLFGCSEEMSQYSPEQVVNNALKETSSLGSYYAEAEMTMNLGNDEKEQILVKEWRNEEGQVKIEMQDKDGTGQSIAVNNGDLFTVYEEEKNQAIIYDDAELVDYNQPSPKEQAMQLLEMIQDTHDLSSEGEEEITGRMTYHLKADAKEEGHLLGDQEIWIDQENWFVLKTISKSGDDISEMTYTMIDFDANIPEDTFTLDLPDDVEMIDLDDVSSSNTVTLSEAADVLNKEFHYFPEDNGLEISNIEMTKLDGAEIQRTEIDIEYTKEDLSLLSMSVFESDEKLGEDDMLPGDELVTIRDQDGFYTDMEGFRMIAWQEDGLNYSLMIIDPSLSLEDVQQLAENMELVE